MRSATSMSKKNCQTSCNIAFDQVHVMPPINVLTRPLCTLHCVCTDCTPSALHCVCTVCCVCASPALRLHCLHCVCSVCTALHCTASALSALHGFRYRRFSRIARLLGWLACRTLQSPTINTWRLRAFRTAR